MFRFENISGGVKTEMMKITPVESVKIGSIEFEPRPFILGTHAKFWLEGVAKFKVREDDVWTVSFPKSGTTWMEEMCWLILNNFDFDKAKRVPLELRISFLELSAMLKSNHDSLESMDAAESPRFIHSHLPLPCLPKELWKKHPKIIYIARDPRDVVVSCYEHFRNWFKLNVSKEEFFKSFINSKIVYSPYFNHVLEFWKIQNQPNILFLSYEEMKTNLEAVILKTFTFLDKPITKNQLDQLLDHLSFSSMKINKSCWHEMQRRLLSTTEPDDNYHFIRRGIVGSYKDELPQELIDSYNEWMRNNLKDTDCDLFKI